MSRPDDNSEEIPHLPDPRELYRQMEEEQSSDKAPLPDPAELFRQMEAEEKAEDEVADLPDPALLYQQMEEESYHFPEEDLGFEIPDPDSVDSGRTITVTLEELEARRNLEEAAPTEDAEVWEAEEPPDMAALLQASLSEVEEEPPEEEAHSAVAELPDPAALFAELEEEDEDSKEPEPAVEKTSPSSELDEDPEVAGFFANLTNRFQPVEPEVEAEPQALRLPEIVKPAPVVSRSDLDLESEPADSRPLPSPEELFQQIKAEEDEAESVQEPDQEVVLPLEEASGPEASQLSIDVWEDLETEDEVLPALPDLEAFKQELEEERRARLDPDLDTELSGPERFVPTVSDSVFSSEASLPAFFAAVPEPEPEKEPPAEPEPQLQREGSPAGTPEPVGDRLSNEDFLAELESDVSEPEPLVGPTGTIRVNEEKVAAEIFQEQESPSRPLLRHPTDAPPITAHKSGGKRPRSQPKSEEKKATQKKKPGKRFSRYKLALFTRQMAVMLKAGIQLHQSVAFAADSDPEMEPLLKQVLQKLESGYSFSNAIADSSRSFDTVYVGLIQAGELSGRLHEMLARLADVLEREIELRKRMISVVTYPTVLLTVSFLGTLGFIFFVLPTLTPLFKDLGVALPLPTRILLASRDFIIPTFAVTVLSIILLVLTRDRISDYIKERPTLERKLAAVPFSIPVVGDVYEKVITARVLYSLSTMLDVGITLNQALARAEVTSGNALTSYRLGKARMDLADGLGVTDCFRLNNLFNPSALHLISAGEEAAKLADMFQYVAKLFDEEVEYALESASSILEPMIMVVMGFIVGFITIAAALPTIQLLQNFS